MRRPQIGRKVRGFVVLLKEMFNDVKVFLTLYQVMSSMGQTMEISYPPIIAAFIDFVRQFASLDLFALPGLGCLDLSSRYIFKFWCRIFSTVSHLSLILSHFSHIYLTFLSLKIALLIFPQVLGAPAADDCVHHLLLLLVQ